MESEKRLVYADTVYEMGHRTPFHIGIADLCDLKELLEDVPTVDAVEVVYGRWIRYHEADIGYDEYGVRCSNCNFEVEDHEVDFIMNYCPNCGANMKGKRNE